MPTSKKSEKNKATIVIWTFKIDITEEPLFFDIFLYFGTKNGDLSQIVFGQKFPKTAVMSSSPPIASKAAQE